MQQLVEVIKTNESGVWVKPIRHQTLCGQNIKAARCCSTMLSALFQHKSFFIKHHANKGDILLVLLPSILMHKLIINYHIILLASLLVVTFLTYIVGYYGLAIHSAMAMDLMLLSSIIFSIIIGIAIFRYQNKNQLNVSIQVISQESTSS